MTLSIAAAPSRIKLHRKSKILELHWGGENFSLPAEFLRVHSPSAEVQGHGPNQAVLQYGKREVAISQLETVGNYALRLYFDDGHNTGIFTWHYLYTLGQNQDTMMIEYEEALHVALRSRDADTQVVNLLPASPPP